ncbi:MAG: hypothetical protein A3D41_02380 [Candidatus Sungbacteria bacterium RIFCSPHIGHO2_02_FULL_41_12b]|nr:MAG: hypothetical protein A3D41_02380 [Candidatus Sungbacteria bacterium RIFCSPHIGHO2_02_FULL_41_12b]
MTDPVLFGRYIGEIARKASKILREEAISQWLTMPIPEFDNLTVMEYVWKYGESGRNRVIQLLENLMD